MANIPPPMALHELKVRSNVIDVAFSAEASMIAVLHQNGIAVFEWKSVAASSSPPMLTGQVSFKKDGLPEGRFHQICFADMSGLLLLQRDALGASLKRYDFSTDTGRMDEGTVKGNSYVKNIDLVKLFPRWINSSFRSRQDRRFTQPCFRRAFFITL